MERSMDERIQQLKDEGYNGELIQRRDAIWCRNCNERTRTADLDLVKSWTFSEAGPPDREILVAATHCPYCRLPSVLVTARPVAPREYERADFP